MLQMLALIAMEHPGMLDVSNIRRERSRVFGALLKPKPDELDRSVIRGQYAGFTHEKNVPSDSKTDTYFKLKAFVENDRWRGVPFYLEGGKALHDKKAGITIFFKAALPCLCPDQPAEGTRNVLSFRIQPDEGIDIRFWAKKPGLEDSIEPRDFSVIYDYGSPERADAYERVLYDCIKGDQTLFVSTDEVRAAWEYISAILNSWDRIPLHIYDKGSSGPKATFS
jgi:glucose-6-phosphate 1-dehydrogenase